LYLIAYTKRGTIINILQTKVFEEAKTLARKIMEEICYDAAYDDIVIFKTNPRGTTCLIEASAEDLDNTLYGKIVRGEL
jgi:hypothetical protein